MRQIVINAETSDEEWHELRKRVKDLGEGRGMPTPNFDKMALPINTVQEGEGDQTLIEKT
jgi:hypothetical protein